MLLASALEVQVSRNQGLCIPIIRIVEDLAKKTRRGAGLTCLKLRDEEEGVGDPSQGVQPVRGSTMRDDS